MHQQLAVSPIDLESVIAVVTFVVAAAVVVSTTAKDLLGK